MNVQIQCRHMRLTESIETLVHRQSKKVKKLLPTFEEHDLDLHAHLEHLSKSKQFHTSLSLNLPQRAIHVEDIENSLVASVSRAFEELVRRVKRFKSSLSRAKYWQKGPIREPVRGRDERPEISEVVHQNLDKLENYIRREIYHTSIYKGLPPGALQTHALVDEVFLKASAAAAPPDLAPEQWMFQIARRVIRDNVSSLEESSRQPHLEESVAGQWDEDSLNFYQPDESLRLEDLLEDRSAATPEEYMRREETEQRLQKAIAHLPATLREAFVLFALEGFNSDEVAMITEKTREEVLQDVERSRQLLREELAGNARS